MHSYDLILTLTGGFGAALVLGYITHRLGLSPIVGYLLAGTLVGPHTPGFVAYAALAEQLAEIGVILLMFGVGLQFHIEELLAVARGRDLRHGAGGREHGRSHPRAGRQQRPAHAGRPHRGGLAGRRRSVHGRRARAAAGAVRSRRRRFAPVRDAGDHRAQGRRARRVHRTRRHARHPARARPRGRDAVARTVHADGAGNRARHRGGLVADLQRVDGAGRVSGGDGRRPVGVQPQGRLRRAPDAGRVRRALLRLGRDAARSGLARHLPRSDPGRPRHRAPRQAGGRSPDRLGDAIPLPGRRHGGDRAVADRRVLLHSWHDRTRSEHPVGRSDRHARRRVDRLDRAQSRALPRHRAHRAPAEGMAVALVEGEPREPGPGRRRGSREPGAGPGTSRGDRRFGADGPHRHSAVEGERHPAHGDRAEHRYRPRVPARRRGRGVRRRDAPRHAGCRGRPERGQPDPDLRGHGQQHGGHPRGPRAEPEDPRPRAGRLPAGPAVLETGRADTIYTGEGEVALAFIENILDRLGATPEQIDRERARAHQELFGRF